MGEAKRIRVEPILSADANDLVKRLHYSGKVCQNSQLHFGAFLDGRLGGVMQFGPSIDKRRMQGLVRGTKWNGFLELNRMAFADWLPRNGESRALGVAMRLIRKHYPQIEWIVSFADGCQCGDGTIYRAAGFKLTQIKRNTTLLRFSGRVVARKTLDDHVGPDGRYLSAHAREAGATPLQGFQLRYIYFLNPEAIERLSCPTLPFSAVEKAGARMYRGNRIGAGGVGGDAPAPQAGEDGSNPIPALQPSR